ncbi:MAG: hypothetical protein AAGB19_03615, partial [Cyanobacteria bacterium P01_F01_bin.3]
MPVTLDRTHAVHTVLFNGDLLPTVCGGMSITGPIKFSAFVDLSAKGKQTPELNHVWLTPGGPNHNLSDEEIATLKKSDQGKEWLAKGVFCDRRPRVRLRIQASAWSAIRRRSRPFPDASRGIGGAHSP